MKPAPVFQGRKRIQPLVPAMDESETAQRVKEVEGTAYVVIQGNKRFIARKRDERDLKALVPWVAISGYQVTSLEAWEDAASKLGI